jgi:arsenite methyltransferase
VLVTAILREAFTAERFARVVEHDPVTGDAEAVAAFARATAPGGILSGVHAFFADQASRVIRLGDTVLDLGCGPAAHLMDLAARHPDCQFIGVDASPGMIAAAKANGPGAIDFRIDDMTELSSVATGSIDVVISSMALHHLPDTAQLAHCFAAVRRVLKPDGRLFIMDFGRLRSLKSVDYFVRRAIPPHEPILMRDYRASLLAAFSRIELESALPSGLRQRVSVYSTIVSPLMMVVATPMAAHAPAAPAASARNLPPRRRADYRQLSLALRLGGMPVR